MRQMLRSKKNKFFIRVLLPNIKTEKRRLSSHSGILDYLLKNGRKVGIREKEREIKSEKKNSSILYVFFLFIFSRYRDKTEFFSSYILAKFRDPLSHFLHPQHQQPHQPGIS